MIVLSPLQTQVAPGITAPLYHWSSERFSAVRRTAISVAEGRARLGVAAATTDYM